MEGFGMGIFGHEISGEVSSKGGREERRKGGLPAVVLEHRNKQAAAMVSVMAGRG